MNHAYLGGRWLIKPLVCGNTFYHASSILLLQSGLVKVGDFSEGSNVGTQLTGSVAIDIV